MAIDASVRLRWIQACVVVGLVVLAIVLILPAIQMSREAARRTQSKNNLKQIGLAIGNFQSSYGRFPSGGTFDPDGHGQHGWAISIWPFVDSLPLYGQVDFKQSWDAPYNASCFQIQVPVFLNPSFPKPDPNRGFAISHYSANSYLLAANSEVKHDEIENRSNTFIMGELGGDFVPWGCPYNWRPLHGLTDAPRTYGRPENFGGHFLMADISVRWIAADTSEEILSVLRGPNLAGDEAKRLNVVRPEAFPFPPDARILPPLSNHRDQGR